ncbi:MAG TPA: hypothetical protein VK216_01340 [Magnetospirillaceae bacterium]|nr:hypothetical protein [Magnetospirillaceae bacterium]
MNKFAPFLFAASCVVVLAVAAGGTSSRAANTPAPTPVVSVTTLPALPSPGTATAHPMTPGPATTVPPLAAPTLPPGQTPAPNATLGLPPPGTAIVISGLVAKPQIITLEQLRKLPSTSLTMRIVDADGKHRFHTFSGAVLRNVIDFAQPLDQGGTSTSTRAYALVQGVGGSSAIVAFPEFENDFAGKHVFLAYTVDAKPAPLGTAMLVIEGDATRGRFIEGITRIIVAEPGP